MSVPRHNTPRIKGGETREVRSELEIICKLYPAEAVLAMVAINRCQSDSEMQRECFALSKVRCRRGRKESFYNCILRDYCLRQQRITEDELCKYQECKCAELCPKSKYGYWPEGSLLARINPSGSHSKFTDKKKLLFPSKRRRDKGDRVVATTS
jgi:hypothetical protein